MGIETTPVEYTRLLYDDVVRWYQSADTKAQVILAIDGAFLAFVTSGVFAKPDDLKAVIDAFSKWTWLFLALTTASLLGSIGAALSCLRSRIYSKKEVDESVERGTSGGTECPRYSADIMWFFQIVAALDPGVFRHTLEGATPAFEIEARASQIQILSRNVRNKHRDANVGFYLAATTLGFLVCAAVTYALQVAG